MLITQKRKEVIDLTQAYYDTPPAIIGAKNGDNDISPEHLKGNTLGVQVSTGHERYATKYLVPAGVGVKTQSMQDEANNDVAAGRLDYVLANSSALYDVLDTDQGKSCCELKAIVEKPKDDPGIYGEGVGAGVRKEDIALKDKLNAAITAMAKAGKFGEIIKNYPQLMGNMTLPAATGVWHGIGGAAACRGPFHLREHAHGLERHQHEPSQAAHRRGGGANGCGRGPCRGCVAKGRGSGAGERDGAGRVGHAVHGGIHRRLRAASGAEARTRRRG